MKQDTCNYQRSAWAISLTIYLSKCWREEKSVQKLNINMLIFDYFTYFNKKH